MNLDEVVQTVAEKGFTERQARFLILVARHSGVCVMRQYSAFAGIVFGQKTRKFFAKLERLGYVSTYDCAHNRARIYHLRYRDLYEAIGAAESRLRRPPAVPRALERLMVLDALGRAQEMLQAAWAQIATPLRDSTRDEVQWYFERLRAARSEPCTGPDAERFKRAEQAFQLRRFPALYRAWLQDGERALTVASSRAISEALKSGAGKIEPLILPHSYGHLSPLVGVA